VVGLTFATVTKARLIPSILGLAADPSGVAPRGARIPNGLQGSASCLTSRPPPR
jgi:hypothetical protein